MLTAWTDSVTNFLLRNDPLDAVWREAAKSLEFVEKAQFQDVAAVILSQQRFIATMQGRTATFSTFSDAQFDEQAFEAELTGKRTATTICLYWILKLQARFLSGTTPRRSRQPRRRKHCFGPQPSMSRCSTTFITPR